MINKNTETKETKVEFPKSFKVTTPLNGCMGFIILCLFTCMAYNGKKWSDIKVEEEQIKLEQLKDGTVVKQPDTVFIYKPDTLHWLKMNQQKER